MKKTDSALHLGRTTPLALLASLTLAACGGTPASTEVSTNESDVATTETAATTEDGLADAYATFKQTLINNGFDQFFTMGIGFHPALSTEKVRGASGNTPSAAVTLDFTTTTIHSTILDAPIHSQFDLWLVKNVAGSGRTVKPETGDQLFK